MLLFQCGPAVRSSRASDRNSPAEPAGPHFFLLHSPPQRCRLVSVPVLRPREGRRREDALRAATMSVHVVSWVLKHSEAKLGQRLVLLALADRAEDDGTNAWPAVSSLARDTRLSERQVQYCLRALEQAGAIKCTGTRRVQGQRGGGVNVYAVLMTKGANTAPQTNGRGAVHSTLGVQPTAPDPSLDPSVGVANATPVQRPARKRDEIWDALEDQYGKAPPSGTNEHGKWNKACKDFKAFGATPATMRTALTAFRRAWPNVKPTPLGVASNYCALMGNGKPLSAYEQAETWVRNVGVGMSDGDLISELQYRGLALADQKKLVRVAIEARA